MSYALYNATFILPTSHGMSVLKVPIVRYHKVIFQILFLIKQITYSERQYWTKNKKEKKFKIRQQINILQFFYWFLDFENFCDIFGVKMSRSLITISATIFTLSINTFIYINNRTFSLSVKKIKVIRKKMASQWTFKIGLEAIFDTPYYFYFSIEVLQTNFCWC